MNGLVDKIRNGDVAAFRELFDDYYPILCVFAMKYIREQEQCKDIAQETLLTYWQNRADFNDIFKVRGYLYRVARNRCLNIIKHGRVGENYTAEALARDEYYFEDEVVRQETYRLVRAAVASLPSQMRRVIELAMQGQKNSEIAAELSIAEGTVHALKKSAYRKLREQLREHFYLMLFWI